MARATIDVVHVGAACRDIASDDPRGWRLGGGVTYAALATARLGLATAAIVGADVLARDATELDRLRDAGVDLRIVPLEEGPVFHNVETAEGRRQTVISVGRPVEPMSVPASWSSARAWSFVPVADEVPDGWADVPTPDAIVAVGWQGLLRRLSAGELVERRSPAPRPLLGRGDVIGVSQFDVPPGTAIASLTALLHDGARLLITQGERGGVLVPVADHDGTALHYLPTATDRAVDPTGAGDTFLAAFLAAVVRPSLMGPLRRRVGAELRFAAAAGSLVVEGIGLAGVPDLMAVRHRALRERVRRLVVPSAVAQVRTTTRPA